MFQHAADEIAHVDQRALGQVVVALDRGFGGRSGCPGDMGQPGRPGDVDPAVDGVDPGGAGIGDDDPGRAEDRQAAEDAEPRIHRLFRQFLAAGNGNLDLDIAGCIVGLRDFGDGGGDHLPRHRVDGRLARPDRQARLGHRADAGTGPETQPAFGPAYRGLDQCAMGHVRVVAGILDDCGRRRVRREFLARQHERGTVAARQRDRHRVFEGSGQQGGIGRLGGCRGAGAGRPAALERSVGCHGGRNKDSQRRCHPGRSAR